MDKQKMRMVNGHINPNTADTYLRGDALFMSECGGAMQAGSTGVPVTEVPEFNFVMLRDRETKIFPRMVITAKSKHPGLINVQEFDSMKKQDQQDLTSGNFVKLYLSFLTTLLPQGYLKLPHLLSLSR